MLILGIETSCDETSVGIVEDGRKILANIVYSQIKEHEPFAGVVPEIASRVHVEIINQIYQKAIEEAEVEPDNLEAIAVVNLPGLVGSLMVGVTFAKTLSLLLNKPLISVNHLIAHIYAVFLTERHPIFPFLALLVSGGHTLLIRVNSLFDYRVLGTTVDDAVGEAYDKVAKLLNLGYPGGPVIDKLFYSAEGEFIDLPVPRFKKEQYKYNFSFSGLKTAVMYMVKKNPAISKATIAKSFQKSSIEFLYSKVVKAVRETGITRVCVVGGVAANSYLRKIFTESKEFESFIPPVELCLDNGATVAGFAYHKFIKNMFADMRLDVSTKPSGGPLNYLNVPLVV
ncbi:MAG: tRNA (adenosine(37)-N6)-threonylcarbamoyltransferase complex transferase subunit TsaD [Spirochaetes bacterium]|nr:MAG: tRNA (adenosine(37)-N6)-threonylcarbamoyltransferase complex transferase subunit TsaD [Spirochaetota bacterium]